ncbi:MAG: hypothetical protein SFW08_01575, partial [Gemmatimonadaceae bacterium]|nr:hypothetical protein [Gemmatimonadaceae bacterium]
CNNDTPAGPEPAPPPPPPPPAISAGTFDLSQADGQSLPAYIAHRQIDGRLEQVYVDSARLTVTDNGRYEQRIWTRRLHNGALAFRDTWVDAGSWQLDGQAYRFTSTGGGRSLTVRTSASPILQVTESMVGWPQAGLVVGVYARRSAPPAEQPPPTDPEPTPITETRFRATDVAGALLSARVVTERDVPHQNAETYTQLDSARLVLRSDATYERVAYYSTWQTPNYVLSLGYIRLASTRDVDRGRYVRRDDGQLTLTSTLYQNRTAVGVHLGDRIRLTQDMTAGDPVRPDVGYTLVP